MYKAIISGTLITAGLILPNAVGIPHDTVAHVNYSVQKLYELNISYCKNHYCGEHHGGRPKY